MPPTCPDAAITKSRVHGGYSCRSPPVPDYYIKYLMYKVYVLTYFISIEMYIKQLHMIMYACTVSSSRLRQLRYRIVPLQACITTRYSYACAIPTKSSSRVDSTPSLIMHLHEFNLDTYIYIYPHAHTILIFLPSNLS